MAIRNPQETHLQVTLSAENLKKLTAVERTSGAGPETVVNFLIAHLDSLMIECIVELPRRPTGGRKHRLHVSEKVRA